MHAYGREFGFRFSVGVAMEIAKRCPDGNIENLTQILNAGTVEALDVMCTLVELASRAFEQAKAFESGEPAGPHLTKEMAQTLDFAQLSALSGEVMRALGTDGKPTVEIDDSKKKESKAAGKSA